MKRGKAIALALVVAIAAAGAGFAYWKHAHPTVIPTEYRRITIARGDVRIMVEATGTIQPENRLVIKPPINGRIESIRVKEGDRVKRGQVLASMSSTERAALLDAARAKGEGEVRHWEDVYRPTPIVAPMSGVVIDRNVENGQTISTQDATFVLSDRLAVVAQVDETDMAKIHIGQKVLITLDAYRDHETSGIVQRIAFEAKTVNNVTMYDAQILPETVPDFMRSGMTASVRFAVDEAREAIIAPTTAIKIEGKNAFVLLPSAAEVPRTRPERREVEVGISDGKMTVIRSGLEEGTVILEEVLRLPDAKSGMNPFAPFSGGGKRGPTGGGGRGNSAPPHP